MERDERKKNVRALFAMSGTRRVFYWPLGAEVIDRVLSKPHHRTAAEWHTIYCKYNIFYEIYSISICVDLANISVLIVSFFAHFLPATIH